MKREFRKIESFSKPHALLKIPNEVKKALIPSGIIHIKISLHSFLSEIYSGRH